MSAPAYYTADPAEPHHASAELSDLFPAYESAQWAAQWAAQAAFYAALATKFRASTSAYYGSSNQCAGRALIAARAVELKEAAP